MYNRSNIAASSISICLLLIVARVRKLHGWLAGASVANYKNAAMRFLYMLEILTAGEREKAWFRLAISLICCDIDKIHKLRKRMYTIRPDNLNLKNGERVSACSILVIKHTFTIYKKTSLGKKWKYFFYLFCYGQITRAHDKQTDEYENAKPTISYNNFLSFYLSITHVLPSVGTFLVVMLLWFMRLCMVVGL